MTPETQSKIAHWRALSAAGQLTKDHMREAIKVLRAERVGAAIASTTAKANTRAKIAVVPNAADLLDELDGL